MLEREKQKGVMKMKSGINKAIQELKDIVWLKNHIEKLEKKNESRGHCSRTFHQIKIHKEVLNNTLNN